MLEIRAEENRLLAAPSLASERVMLRYFPGARWIPARGAFSLPRQTGVYLLLDELFGPENWRAPSDLSEEVQEARKAGGSPTAEARLEDAESEFSVQCAFADKELVKRVPGYRWVPTERRWRLPRVPLTVRVLQRVFGEQLKIEDEERVLAWCTEEEQRTDAERRLAEREDAATAGSGPGATGLAAVPAPEAPAATSQARNVLNSGDAPQAMFTAITATAAAQAAKAPPMITPIARGGRTIVAVSSRRGCVPACTMRGTSRSCPGYSRSTAGSASG